MASGDCAMSLYAASATAGKMDQNESICNLVAAAWCRQHVIANCSESSRRKVGSIDLNINIRMHLDGVCWLLPTVAGSYCTYVKVPYLRWLSWVERRVHCTHTEQGVTTQSTMDTIIMMHALPPFCTVLLRSVRELLIYAAALLYANVFR